MVETGDFGQLRDSAHGGWLDRPGLGRILAERQVSSSPVVASEVALEDPTEMALAEDDYMVEAFSTYRPHKALGVWVLPRTPRRGQHRLDAHAAHPTAERLPVDTSRSRILYSGAVSSGKASTICWAVQRALGCSVTLQWTTRRRS
jgi:hypothetical protein